MEEPQVPRPTTWTSFLTLVALPTIAFFGYAFYELSSSNAVGREISTIIQGSQSDAGLVSVLPQVRHIADTVRDGNLGLFGSSANGALQNAQALTTGIAEFRSDLVDAGLTSDDPRPLMTIVRDEIADSQNDELRATILDLQTQLSDLQSLQAVLMRGDHSYDVHFAFDSSELVLPAPSTLFAIGQRELANGNSKVTITGFADREGETEYNCALSARRTAAVLRSLPQGIDAIDIPLGESDVPIDPHIDGYREPANRIVRLTFGVAHQDSLKSCQQAF